MERTIEIPFGAKDSELKGWEYTIPENMEAEIKDGKIIVKQKESEDERIRKQLIVILDNLGNGIIPIPENIEEIYAYLEKQKPMYNLEIPAGDVAPAEEDSPFDEDEFLEDELSAFLQNYDKEYDDDAAVSDVARHFYEIGKKQKDQKPYEPKNWPADKDNLTQEQSPAEWSEDYREEDLRTRFAFYTYKDEDDALYLSNVFVEETSRNKGFGTKILAAAEKVAETLGAINIRLKVKQNSPANAWYRKNGYGYSTFEGDYDWLEKTLEYLKPSKKEWSEEDESVFESACNALEIHGHHKLSNMLKSLRPQPHWKPSEEQMKALENEIKYELCAGLHTRAGILQTLYDDLLKNL